MTNKLNIDVSQTNEKFKHLASEIIDFLIEKLQKLDTLELEIHKKTSPNETGIDLMDLWKEYNNRCEEIIAPIRLTPYIGNLRSYGQPAKYEYFNTASTKITFIMKSAGLVVIETEYELGMGLKNMEQFTLKKVDSGWKIDAKKCGFPKQNKWMMDEI